VKFSLDRNDTGEEKASNPTQPVYERET